MATAELPVTVVECDGCGEEMNLLAPYLFMRFRPQREVLISEEVPSEDPNEIADNTVYLGTKAGRGVLKRFHDFDCMGQWVGEREGLEPKLEHHREDEIYVAEDNPDDEEIAARAAAAAEAGEI